MADVEGKKRKSVPLSVWAGLDFARHARFCLLWGLPCLRADSAVRSATIHHHSIRDWNDKSREIRNYIHVCLIVYISPLPDQAARSAPAPKSRASVTDTDIIHNYT